MLENWLAPLLTRVLGDYVKPECFDAASLHLNVWSGYCVLRDLELKPEALDGLQLPIALRRGYIGCIEFQLPWGTPGTKPTVVKIDEVYLLLETRYEWTGARAERRAEMARQAKLSLVSAAQDRARARREQREALRRLQEQQRQQLFPSGEPIGASAESSMAPGSSGAGMPTGSTVKSAEPLLSSIFGGLGANSGADGGQSSPFDSTDIEAALDAYQERGGDLAALTSGSASSAAAAPGFISKLITKILDNLQVHVRGLHVRWEDRVSVPGQPFAAGVTLESLHVESTNEEWRPLFGEESRRPGGGLASAFGIATSMVSGMMFGAGGGGGGGGASAFGGMGSGRGGPGGRDGAGAGSIPRLVFKTVNIVCLATYFTTLPRRHQQQQRYGHGHRQKTRGDALQRDQAAPTNAREAPAITQLEAHDAHATDAALPAPSSSSAQPRGSGRAADGASRAPQPAVSDIPGDPAPASGGGSRSRAAHSSTTTMGERWLLDVDLSTLEREGFVAAMQVMIARRQNLVPDVGLPHFSAPVPLAHALRSAPISGARSAAQASSAGGTTVTGADATAITSSLRNRAASQGSSAVGGDAASTSTAATSNAMTHSATGNLAASKPRMSSGTSAARSQEAAWWFSELPSSRMVRSYPFPTDLLLLPLDCVVRLQLNKNPNSTKHPQTVLTVELRQVLLQLQSAQYQSVLALAAGFSAYKTRARYASLRPAARLITGPVVQQTESGTAGPARAPNAPVASGPGRPLVAPSADRTRSRVARAWWRYAILAVMHDLSAGTPFLRWRDAVQRRHVRQAYVSLFRRYLAGTLPALPWPADKTRLFQEYTSSERYAKGSAAGDVVDGEAMRRDGVKRTDVGAAEGDAAAEMTRAARDLRLRRRSMRERRAAEAEAAGRRFSTASTGESSGDEASTTRRRGRQATASGTRQSDSAANAADDSELLSFAVSGPSSDGDRDNSSPDGAGSAMAARRRQKRRASLTEPALEAPAIAPVAPPASKEQQAAQAVDSYSDAHYLKQLCHRSVFRLPWLPWARRLRAVMQRFSGSSGGLPPTVVGSVKTRADAHPDAEGGESGYEGDSRMEDAFAELAAVLQDRGPNALPAPSQQQRQPSVAAPASSAYLPPAFDQQLNDQETALMSFLEDQLPAADILLFRSVAERDVAVEQARRALTSPVTSASAGNGGAADGKGDASDARSARGTPPRHVPRSSFASGDSGASSFVSVIGGEGWIDEEVDDDQQQLRSLQGGSRRGPRSGSGRSGSHTSGLSSIAGDQAQMRGGSSSDSDGSAYSADTEIRRIARGSAAPAAHAPPRRSTFLSEDSSREAVSSSSSKDGSVSNSGRGGGSGRRGVSGRDEGGPSDADDGSGDESGSARVPEAAMLAGGSRIRRRRSAHLDHRQEADGSTAAGARPLRARRPSGMRSSPVTLSSGHAGSMGAVTAADAPTGSAVASSATRSGDGTVTIAADGMSAAVEPAANGQAKRGHHRRSSTRDATKLASSLHHYASAATATGRRSRASLQGPQPAPSQAPSRIHSRAHPKARSSRQRDGDRGREDVVDARPRRPTEPPQFSRALGSPQSGLRGFQSDSDASFRGFESTDESVQEGSLHRPQAAGAVPLTQAAKAASAAGAGGGSLSSWFNFDWLWSGAPLPGNAAGYASATGQPPIVHAPFGAGAPFSLGLGGFSELPSGGTGAPGGLPGTAPSTPSRTHLSMPGTPTMRPAGAGALLPAPTPAESIADAQRREIFAIIDYDPSKVLEPYHRSYTVTKIVLQVTSGSVTLAHSASAPLEAYARGLRAALAAASDAPSAQSFGGPRPVLHLSMGGLALELDKRPTTHKLELTLRSLAAHDLTRSSAPEFSRLLSARRPPAGPVAATAAFYSPTLGTSAAFGGSGAHRSSSGGLRHVSSEASFADSHSLGGFDQRLPQTSPRGPASGPVGFEPSVRSRARGRSSHSAGLFAAGGAAGGDHTDGRTVGHGSDAFGDDAQTEAKSRAGETAGAPRADDGLPLLHFVYQTHPPDSSVSAATAAIGAALVDTETMTEADTQPASARDRGSGGGMVNSRSVGTLAPIADDGGSVASGPSSARGGAGASVASGARSARSGMTGGRSISRRKTRAAPGSAGVGPSRPAASVRSKSRATVGPEGRAGARASGSTAGSLAPSRQLSLGAASTAGSLAAGSSAPTTRRSDAATIRTSSGGSKKPGTGGARGKRQHRLAGADVSLVLELQQLEATYNPAATASIVQIFSQPAGALADLPGGADVGSRAMQTVRSVQQRVASRLEQAYHQRVALYLQITLSPPVVIVPANLSDPESVVLVVDPGQLRLRTRALRQKQAVMQLLNAATSAAAAPAPMPPIPATARVDANHGGADEPGAPTVGRASPLPDHPPGPAAGSFAAFADSSAHAPAAPVTSSTAANLPWKDDFYDAYVVKLTGAQVLLARARTDWRSPQVQSGCGLSLALVPSVTLNVHSSIVPQDTSQPRLRVDASVPYVGAHVSSSQSNSLHSLLIEVAAQRKKYAPRPTASSALPTVSVLPATRASDSRAVSIVTTIGSYIPSMSATAMGRRGGGTAGSGANGGLQAPGNDGYASAASIRGVLLSPGGLLLSDGGRGLRSGLPVGSPPPRARAPSGTFDGGMSVSAAPMFSPSLLSGDESATSALGLDPGRITLRRYQSMRARRHMPTTESARIDAVQLMTQSSIGSGPQSRPALGSGLGSHMGAARNPQLSMFMGGSPLATSGGMSFPQGLSLRPPLGSTTATPVSAQPSGPGGLPPFRLDGGTVHDRAGTESSSGGGGNPHAGAFTSVPPLPAIGAIGSGPASLGEPVVFANPTALHLTLQLDKAQLVLSDDPLDSLEKRWRSGDEDGICHVGAFRDPVADATARVKHAYDGERLVAKLTALGARGAYTTRALDTSVELSLQQLRATDLLLEARYAGSDTGARLKRLISSQESPVTLKPFQPSAGILGGGLNDSFDTDVARTPIAAAPAHDTPPGLVKFSYTRRLVIPRANVDGAVHASVDIGHAPASSHVVPATPFSPLFGPSRAQQQLSTVGSTDEAPPLSQETEPFDETVVDLAFASLRVNVNEPTLMLLLRSFWKPAHAGDATAVDEAQSQSYSQSAAQAARAEAPAEAPAAAGPQRAQAPASLRQASVRAVNRVRFRLEALQVLLHTGQRDLLSFHLTDVRVAVRNAVIAERHLNCVGNADRRFLAQSPALLHASTMAGGSCGMFDSGASAAQPSSSDTDGVGHLNDRASTGGPGPSLPSLWRNPLFRDSRATHASYASAAEAAGLVSETDGFATSSTTASRVEHLAASMGRFNAGAPAASIARVHPLLLVQPAPTSVSPELVTVYIVVSETLLTSSKTTATVGDLRVLDEWTAVHNEAANPAKPAGPSTHSDSPQDAFVPPLRDGRRVLFGLRDSSADSSDSLLDYEYLSAPIMDDRGPLQSAAAHAGEARHAELPRQSAASSSSATFPHAQSRGSLDKGLPRSLSVTPAEATGCAAAALITRAGKLPSRAIFHRLHCRSVAVFLDATTLELLGSYVRSSELLRSLQKNPRPAPATSPRAGEQKQASATSRRDVGPVGPLVRFYVNVANPLLALPAVVRHAPDSADPDRTVEHGRERRLGSATLDLGSIVLRNSFDVSAQSASAAAAAPGRKQTPQTSPEQPWRERLAASVTALNIRTEGGGLPASKLLNDVNFSLDVSSPAVFGPRLVFGEQHRTTISLQLSLLDLNVTDAHAAFLQAIWVGTLARIARIDWLGGGISTSRTGSQAKQPRNLPRGSPDHHVVVDAACDGLALRVGRADSCGGVAPVALVQLLALRAASECTVASGRAVTDVTSALLRASPSASSFVCDSFSVLDRRLERTSLWEFIIGPRDLPPPNLHLLRLARPSKPLAASPRAGPTTRVEAPESVQVEAPFLSVRYADRLREAAASSAVTRTVDVSCQAPRVLLVPQVLAAALAFAESTASRLAEIPSRVDATSQSAKLIDYTMVEERSPSMSPATMAASDQPASPLAAPLVPAVPLGPVASSVLPQLSSVMSGLRRLVSGESPQQQQPVSLASLSRAGTFTALTCSFVNHELWLFEDASSPLSAAIVIRASAEAAVRVAHECRLTYDQLLRRAIDEAGSDPEPQPSLGSSVRTINLVLTDVEMQLHRRPADIAGSGGGLPASASSPSLPRASSLASFRGLGGHMRHVGSIGSFAGFPQPHSAGDFRPGQLYPEEEDDEEDFGQFAVDGNTPRPILEGLRSMSPTARRHLFGGSGASLPLSLSASMGSLSMASGGSDGSQGGLSACVPQPPAGQAAADDADGSYTAAETAWQEQLSSGEHTRVALVLPFTASLHVEFRSAGVAGARSDTVVPLLDVNAWNQRPALSGAGHSAAGAHEDIPGAFLNAASQYNQAVCGLANRELLPVLRASAIDPASSGSRLEVPAQVATAAFARLQVGSITVCAAVGEIAVLRKVAAAVGELAPASGMPASAGSSSPHDFYRILPAPRFALVSVAFSNARVVVVRRSPDSTLAMPLLALQLRSLEGKITSQHAATTVSTTGDLVIDYCNVLVNRWEPMLDVRPVQVDVALPKPIDPVVQHALGANSAASSSAPGTQGGGKWSWTSWRPGRGGNGKSSASSPRNGGSDHGTDEEPALSGPVHVTVSNRSVARVFITSAGLSAVGAAFRGDESAQARPFYQLVNMSGEPLAYAVMRGGSPRSDAYGGSGEIVHPFGSADVQAPREVFVWPASKVLSAADSAAQPTTGLKLRVGLPSPGGLSAPSAFTLPAPVFTAEGHHAALLHVPCTHLAGGASAAGTVPRHVELVAEVRPSLNGMRTVVLRSTLFLANRLSEAVAVTAQSSTRPMPWRAVLRNGETTMLPASLASDPGATVIITSASDGRVIAGEIPIGELGWSSRAGRRMVTRDPESRVHSWVPSGGPAHATAIACLRYGTTAHRLASSCTLVDTRTADAVKQHGDDDGSDCDSDSDRDEPAAEPRNRSSQAVFPRRSASARVPPLPPAAVGVPAHRHLRLLSLHEPVAFTNRLPVACSIELLQGDASSVPLGSEACPPGAARLHVAPGRRSPLRLSNLSGPLHVRLHLPNTVGWTSGCLVTPPGFLAGASSASASPLVSPTGASSCDNVPERYAGDRSRACVWLTCSDASGLPLQVGLEVSRAAHGGLRLVAFAPYWLVNRTGLPLSFLYAWEEAAVTGLGVPQPAVTRKQPVPCQETCPSDSPPPAASAASALVGRGSPLLSFARKVADFYDGSRTRPEPDGAPSSAPCDGAGGIGSSGKLGRALVGAVASADVHSDALPLGPGPLRLPRSRSPSAAPTLQRAWSLTLAAPGFRESGLLAMQPQHSPDDVYASRHDVSNAVTTEQHVTLASHREGCPAALWFTLTVTSAVDARCRDKRLARTVVVSVSPRFVLHNALPSPLAVLIPEPTARASFASLTLGSALPVEQRVTSQPCTSLVLRQEGQLVDASTGHDAATSTFKAILVIPAGSRVPLHPPTTAGPSKHPEAPLVRVTTLTDEAGDEFAGRAVLLLSPPHAHFVNDDGSGLAGFRWSGLVPLSGGGPGFVGSELQAAAPSRLSHLMGPVEHSSHTVSARCAVLMLERAGNVDQDEGPAMTADGQFLTVLSTRLREWDPLHGSVSRWDPLGAGSTLLTVCSLAARSLEHASALPCTSGPTVTLRPDEPIPPPMLLRNCSTIPLRFTQSGVPGRGVILRPGSSAPFSWWEPHAAPHSLCIVTLDGRACLPQDRPLVVLPHTVGYREASRAVGGGAALRFEVALDGRTQVITAWGGHRALTDAAPAVRPRNWLHLDVSARELTIACIDSDADAAGLSPASLLPASGVPLAALSLVEVSYKVEPAPLSAAAATSAAGALLQARTGGSQAPDESVTSFTVRQFSIADCTPGARVPVVVEPVDTRGGGAVAPRDTSEAEASWLLAALRGNAAQAAPSHAAAASSATILSAPRTDAEGRYALSLTIRRRPFSLPRRSRNHGDRVPFPSGLPFTHDASLALRDVSLDLDAELVHRVVAFVRTCQDAYALPYTAAVNDAGAGPVVASPAALWLSRGAVDVTTGTGVPARDGMTLLSASRKRPWSSRHAATSTRPISDDRLVPIETVLPIAAPSSLLHFSRITVNGLECRLRLRPLRTGGSDSTVFRPVPGWLRGMPSLDAPVYVEGVELRELVSSWSFEEVVTALAATPTMTLLRVAASYATKRLVRGRIAVTAADIVGAALEGRLADAIRGVPNLPLVITSVAMDAAGFWTRQLQRVPGVNRALRLRPAPLGSPEADERRSRALAAFAQSSARPAHLGISGSLLRALESHRHGGDLEPHAPLLFGLLGSVGRMAVTPVDFALSTIQYFRSGGAAALTLPSPRTPPSPPAGRLSALQRAKSGRDGARAMHVQMMAALRGAATDVSSGGEEVCDSGARVWAGRALLTMCRPGEASHYRGHVIAEAVELPRALALAEDRGDRALTAPGAVATDDERRLLKLGPTALVQAGGSLLVVPLTGPARLHVAASVPVGSFSVRRGVGRDDPSAALAVGARRYTEDVELVIGPGRLSRAGAAPVRQLYSLTRSDGSAQIPTQAYPALGLAGQTTMLRLSFITEEAAFLDALLG